MINGSGLIPLPSRLEHNSIWATNFSLRRLLSIKVRAIITLANNPHAVIPKPIRSRVGQ